MIVLFRFYIKMDLRGSNHSKLHSSFTPQVVEEKELARSTMDKLESARKKCSWYIFELFSFNSVIS